MRKVLIVLGALGVVLIGFWVYAYFMDTAPIPVMPTVESPDLQMPATESDMQAIGDAKPETVGRTRYFRYDPVTKDLDAEYGFQLLLNPGEGSSRWRVEKPYIIFYQTNYQCRIDSERGTFQVESAGDHNVPKDAQLDENVVIHITPAAGSSVTETTIYMDDLTFSSERSEFSTDGPVTIQSDRMELSGYGLVLIFNTGLGKVEYLEIKDMDFLRLQGFASSDSPMAGGAIEGSPSAKVVKPSAGTGHQSRASDRLPVADSARQDDGVSPEAAEVPEELPAESLYQCNILDNVLIQYGTELMVSGAERVDIMNIRFSGSDEASEPVADAADAGRSDNRETAAQAPRPAGATASASGDKPAPKTGSTDASQDVIVRCDGGMIIQPMQPRIGTDATIADADLSLEMSGTPLKINRLVPDAVETLETVAHCGALYYSPADEILQLFTNTGQPQILLNTQRSNSRIETSGSVRWDRRAQRANIAGPGKVYLGDSQNPAAAPSEISFNGMMDLLFAEMPDDIASAAIRTINLTGGMDAVMRQNGTLKTLADSAVLEFVGENELSHARLNGDVRFESLEDGKAASRAAAQSAVFTFDKNQIASADLAGAVQFVSASGQMDSSNARIEFTPDTEGTVHPTMIRTTGDSVLQAPSNGTSQPPARFEARKIDYDMQTGSGLAHGPIRFTFYQPAGTDGASDPAMTPVTITADEHARFLADADRTIRQVVFQKNVIATRVFETPLFTQRDEFHGDRLIVDIDGNADGRTGIRQITFTEGNVFGQSQKLQGEEALFQVRLTCREMVHDQSTGVILAKGPGEIQLNNSRAEAAGDRSSGIHFERPCYALINGFDTIEWDLQQRQITANGDEKTMQFAYVPLVDGQPEQYIFISSQKLNAHYRTDDAGKPTVEKVFTDQGITYTEMDKHRDKVLRTLIGQTLDYNALSDVGWLTISGSEANPCFVNGNRVPVIRYNLNTGQLQTSLSAQPGVLRAP